MEGERELRKTKSWSSIKDIKQMMVLVRLRQ